MSELREAPREVAADDDPTSVVGALVDRARIAQRAFETWPQPRVDEAVTAAAWAIMEPGRNRALAELAVRATGLGDVADKIAKNHRKTLGLLRDLAGAKSVGVISEDRERGLIEIARPAGVVAAITPSTNPAATPANNILNALKGRNAIIVAPSPKGHSTLALLLDFVHAELDRIGAPRDLVLQLPAPVRREHTYALMRAADLVVATGSQTNVRAAYASGTPAVGVGAGNVSVIVDETADVRDAAAKIARSKTFDHATSCSSENSVIAVAAVHDTLVAALEAEGGVLLTDDETRKLEATMFAGGKLSPSFIAQAAGAIAARAGLDRPDVRGAKFLIVAERGVGPSHPFSGEKLSPVLALYRAGALPPRRRSPIVCCATRARATRSVCTRARRSVRCNWASRSRSVASSSTRRTVSRRAAASTTHCRSRCRWGAGPGAATASPITSTTGISSTSRASCIRCRPTACACRPTTNSSPSTAGSTGSSALPAMRTVRDVVDRHSATQPDAPFLLAPESRTTISYAGLRDHRAGALRGARRTRRPAGGSRFVPVAEWCGGGERFPGRDVRRVHRLADQHAGAGRAGRAQHRAFGDTRHLRGTGIRRAPQSDRRAHRQPRDRSANLTRRAAASVDLRDAPRRRARRASARAPDVHVGHDRQAEGRAPVAREPDSRRARGRAGAPADSGRSRALVAAALPRQRSMHRDDLPARIRRQHRDAASFQRFAMVDARRYVSADVAQCRPDDHRVSDQRLGSLGAAGLGVPRRALRAIGVRTAASRAPPRIRGAVRYLGARSDGAHRVRIGRVRESARSARAADRIPRAAARPGGAGRCAGRYAAR